MREIRSAVITGPTGTIGAALCQLLIRKGIRVWAAVRPGSRKRSYLPESDLLGIIECDASELPSLTGRIRHADAFFHLAWKGTGRGSRDNMKVQAENIGNTQDAAGTAAALGCQIMIGAGSQAEYGLHSTPLTSETPCFPLTGYGAAKHCAGILTRRRCGQLGIDCIWMRILSVYGPCQESGNMISEMITKLLNREKLSVTEGRQIWDFLYCDDAAEALLAAAQNGISDSVYALGSGQAKPLRVFIEMLRDTVDPSLPIGFGEIPYSPEQIMHLEADLTELTRDTGFVPRIPFDEGIRRTVAWRISRASAM